MSSSLPFSSALSLSLSLYYPLYIEMHTLSAKTIERSLAKSKAREPFNFASNVAQPFAVCAAGSEQAILHFTYRSGRLRNNTRQAPAHSPNSAHFATLGSLISTCFDTSRSRLVAGRIFNGIKRASKWTTNDASTRLGWRAWPPLASSVSSQAAGARD